MKVTLIRCGPAANESELKGVEHLRSRLISEPGDGEWILLTNLAFSVNHQLQSDEIDLVAIGPTGVRVVEVKHWLPQWADQHEAEAMDEADRVTMKARKVGTTLKRVVPSIPFVGGAFLLTQDPSLVQRLAGKVFRGVGLHSLNDWKAAIGFENERVLSLQQVRRLSETLQPRSKVAIDGSLRRLAGYVNLELQTPREQRFHRIYKGSHPARRDRVMLHLYDLSAIDDKKAETRARREFEALHRLQLYSWAPRVLDSFQEAPGYEGEMFFFTLLDPAAPTLRERTSDATWDVGSRLAFARNTARAVAELHSAQADGEPIVHRNLSPRTILVRHDNTPIITGFEWSKLPSESSIATTGLPAGWETDPVAPEVRAQGLGAADQRSDLYSLVASLRVLFLGKDEPLWGRVTQLLARGMEVVPDERCTAEDIDTGISELLGESIPPQAPPPARFWTEDQVVRFHDHDYRIVARLGSGGVGTTFKVVETDQTTGEELGTYVAKVAHDREVGRRVLRAYSLARSHLPAHTALSTIFEVAKEWRENEFIAVMRWVSGTPLAEFIGVFPLLAEENQESSAETLALRWLRTTCEALAVLHRNGLVHGDVSPRNLIVSGTELVLTDYDFVQKTDEPKAAPGTLLYSPAAHQESPPASPSDDLYALGTSFFHVVFGREPFRDSRQGLNWGDVCRGDFPSLAAFLDRATHADPQLRFANAGDALAFLNTYEAPSQLVPAEDKATRRAEPLSLAGQAAQPGTPVELSERSVEWLLALLQSYPGSSWGNQETRGLDTEFAARTYVSTSVEERLLLDVRARRLRLAILCGNAGDGKTALLQHVADRLGLGKHQSSERILEGRVTNGPLVRINLDGSASLGKLSADELLDGFLEPFRDGPPSEDLVHLLAINDGRLLEWIQAVELRNGGNPTSLTSELNSSLQGEEPSKDSHVRFINLNQRSLVGGILPDRSKIDTAFLDRLVTHLYGADQARAYWEPCLSCSAKGRCEVFNAARLFGPDQLPSAADANVRARARARLFEALQAVHLRGETHITMRELRAALVYILFGVHNCDDYHAGAESPPLPYWDRAFAADSPARQGDVLRELARLDPALEAHPQIDRHLLRPSAEGVATLDTAYWPTGAESSHGSALASARRRAYFEWSPEDLERVAGEREALGLGRGRHLREFSNLPLYDDSKIGEVCERLCRGISRLEDLPPEALDRRDVVPLRVQPRTPTETAFWVEKELSAFRLEADVPQEAEGSEVLHRQARLVYRYRNGQEEVLRLGAELFSLLMELADGYQLGDVSTDDAFAHLSIFVQRLVREDERRLLAWNPMQDEAVYQVYATVRKPGEGTSQVITIESLRTGEPD